MKWKIIAIGKPSLSYARVGLEEYLGRLRHYTDVEFVALKDGREDQVAARMLKASEG
ncbi:MAG: 23S rRNA (pseudouridine(1915)-N(3))-methyltransferase RlmH, partial [Verrucomicrobiales bacterium]